MALEQLQDLGLVAGRSGTLQKLLSYLLGRPSSGRVLLTPVTVGPGTGDGCGHIFQQVTLPGLPRVQPARVHLVLFGRKL